MTIEYKYNEGDLLREITDYVNSTYDGHYSQNQYQATEFIIDGGHGVGFTVGNILKYAQRYGHKGTPEDWRKDLMKVIHYAIIAMYVHDTETERDGYDFVMPTDWGQESVDAQSIQILGLDTVGLDTITLRTSDPLPDWSKHNMGTSSLLTSAEPYSIIKTETKNSKKKKD